MPLFQVTLAASTASCSPTSTAQETLELGGFCKVLSAGKSACPVDVALMKLVPSLNQFSNDELSADLLSQRLLRALLVKDIAMQTGISKSAVTIQEVLPAPCPPPESPKSLSEDRSSVSSSKDGGSSPIAIQKKTVSFSSLPILSSSPNAPAASLAPSLPPIPQSSSKRTVIFAQESHCHREEIFVFSSSEAPVASSPSTRTGMVLSSSPPMASHLPTVACPPSPSSRTSVASSPSSSYLLHLPTSSSPGVEVYQVNETLSSHVDAATPAESHAAVDAAKQCWKAEGSARVVIDRSKRSIVIEQYSCRFFTF